MVLNSRVMLVFMLQMTNISGPSIVEFNSRYIYHGFCSDLFPQFLLYKNTEREREREREIERYL